MSRHQFRKLVTGEDVQFNTEFPLERSAFFFECFAYDRGYRHDDSRIDAMLFSRQFDLFEGPAVFVDSCMMLYLHRDFVFDAQRIKVRYFREENDITPPHTIGLGIEHSAISPNTRVFFRQLFARANVPLEEPKVVNVFPTPPLMQTALVNLSEYEFTLGTIGSKNRTSR